MVDVTPVCEHVWSHISGRRWCPKCGADGCGHRSPLNYDRTRYATCELRTGHDGDHRQGEFIWTDRTMPYRERPQTGPM